MSPLRLATRSSALATTQSRLVADALGARTGRAVELVTVTTRGDVDRAPLSQIGGQGVFVAAVRQAVLDGEADLAVHSCKDLPTAPEPRLALAAVGEREDVRDVLVARDGLDLAGLPSGARVGTGAPRRVMQLRALRPDLEVVDVRGNVPTRLALVDDGRVDAVVLAAAGLSRLGLLGRATEVLGCDTLLPAPGQGALAVECRADHRAVVAALLNMQHDETRAAVDAERALLAATGAGCSSPVAAWARPVDGRLRLTALTDGPGGGPVRAEGVADMDQAAGLGRRVATELLAARADGEDAG